MISVRSLHKITHGKEKLINLQVTQILEVQVVVVVAEAVDLEALAIVKAGAVEAAALVATAEAGAAVIVAFKKLLIIYFLII